jgi:hypothetical protein
MKLLILNKIFFANFAENFFFQIITLTPGCQPDEGVFGNAGAEQTGGGARQQHQGAKQESPHPPDGYLSRIYLFFFFCRQAFPKSAIP